MRNYKLEMFAFLEIINHYSNKKYQIESYKPNKKRLYSLNRENYGRKTTFMEAKEFVAYLKGFCAGINNEKYNSGEN